MASYHLTATIIGRSEGRSAVAAAAYRACVKMLDPDSGAVHDYRRKSGLLSSFIMTPENAPKWASDRDYLWLNVHLKEKRKNSQLAREIRVALPDELSLDEQQELLRNWVREHITSHGIAADIAIHAPSKKGDERNVHAHIMTTTRQFDSTDDGWSKSKDRHLNSTEFLEGLRSSWATHQNAALARAGSSATVDHRSLKAQREAALEAGDHDLALALDRPPEPRVGVVATAMDQAAGRPISERGKELAEARKQRSKIMAALEMLKRATSEIAAAMTEAITPKADQATLKIFAMRRRNDQRQTAPATPAPTPAWKSPEPD